MFYAYECEKCGRSFEEWQGMNDAHKAVCPECSNAAQRVFSPHKFSISYPNGGDHGDGLNMGLAKKHFKSNRQRDYYADSHGLQKAPSGFDYG